MNAKHYVDFVKYAKGFEYNYKTNPDYVTSEGRSTDKFIMNIMAGIKKSHIFEIDDDIKKLLALTTTPNKNDDINLPFPYIFLDVGFTKKELNDLGINTKKTDEIIGIMVTTGNLVYGGDDTFKKAMIKKMNEMLDNETIDWHSEDMKKYLKEIKVVEHNMMNSDELSVGKALRITMCSILNNGQFWFDTYNKNFNLNPLVSDWNLKVEEIKTTDKKSKEFVHKFVINFLNFLYDPEIEYYEVKRSKKSQERREKQGKVVIPSTNKIIVKGELKRAINSISSSGALGHYSHRFWVRGYYKKYTDERYVNMKGKIQYVLPYVKGEGVLIEKTYRLEKDKNEKD